MHYFLTGFLSLVEAEMDNVLYRKSRRTPITISPTLLKTKSMEGEYEYQLNAMQQVLNSKHGILDLATGAGKTAIAAALSIVLPKKVLFIVPGIELMWQTHAAFEEDTDLTLTCAGGGEIPDPEADVCIGVYKSVWINETKNKGWLKQFKTVFIDECHRATTKDYVATILSCCNAEYKIGLSGTPHAITEDKVMHLTGLIGPILSTVTGKVLSDLGVNAKPVINLHSYEQLEVDNEWPKCYIEGVVTNSIRNRKVISLVTAGLQANKICMVLIKRTQHGNLLQDMFLQQGYDVPYIDGSSSKKDRRKYLTDLREGKLRALIISRIGEEGLDIPQLDVIVRASGGLSPISTIQALGRGLRRKKGKENIVSYHDFSDTSCRILTLQTEQRFLDYEKEGYGVRIHKERDDTVL